MQLQPSDACSVESQLDTDTHLASGLTALLHCVQGKPGQRQGGSLLELPLASRFGQGTIHICSAVKVGEDSQGGDRQVAPRRSRRKAQQESDGEQEGARCGAPHGVPGWSSAGPPEHGALDGLHSLAAAAAAAGTAGSWDLQPGFVR